MTFMALLVRSCTTPVWNSDALHLLDSLISVGWAQFKLWPHCTPPLPVPIKCHASCRNHWCIQTSCIQETGLDIHPPYWNPLMLSRVVLLGENLNGHDCKTNTTQRERQPKRLWASACGTCISAALSNHCSTLTQSRTRSCGNFLQWEINKAHREKTRSHFFDPLPFQLSSPIRRATVAMTTACEGHLSELHGRPAHLHLFPVPGIFVNQLKH